MIFLYLLTFILFAGYKVYIGLIYATPFQSWMWATLSFLGMSLLLWASFTWKFPNFSWIGIILLVVGLFANKPEFFKVALSVFIASILYGLIGALGLEIKTNLKIYWRGKRI